ncbi:AAA domain-containing protein, putative AbiEii toxin, Type IV TA system [Rhodovulum sp. ES.010]|uniref:AAA family ATPase n=1 Tax=Rhodovulum sp. ES.010 TaxID=1882821 RepID=UPI000927B27E|nr:AAA family ATPase [Rhodovulum sp. ES.010]SIO54663.1 AAA domain-containing protein, putative AbiEii toxin, Type IV TA system [Rhodovulum sp. ES.010]
MRHDSIPHTPAPEAVTPPEPGPTSSDQLTLLRYRVTNFRSVKDSDWLDLGRITALVGVNESGKTNLLLPLWKLNPVADGLLDPVSDYPKAMFAEIRNAPDAYRFILAEFDTGQAADVIAERANIPVDAARRVAVGRLFDGSYTVDFPDYARPRQTDARRAAERLRSAHARIEAAETQPGEDELHASVLDGISAMLAEIEAEPVLTGNDMMRLRNRVSAMIPEEIRIVSATVAELRALRRDLGAWMTDMLAPDPGQIDTVRDAVLSRLPRFVYYSSWGNLDSEIYLPHVVDNLGRGDLGPKEASKARTLRVLFGFVGLEPTEILELGRDFSETRDEARRRLARAKAERNPLESLIDLIRSTNSPDLGPDPMARIAEAKRTRSILLQSAGNRLSERFGEWWRVRDYRFRFEADGNHFRIWVSDSERAQEVELEERSTGLQWFLSFFLVFLHESAGLHRRAVLLLDEPGLSLHPLAQRDLSTFFDEIARNHQIVYTAHSPFLVDADRLERARKVFVGEDGSTRVTSDLCAPEGRARDGGAAYAVRSAVNMAVAEASFGGADTVLVPGVVEQIYLTAMKTMLIGAGDFKPARDILFAPAGDPGIALRMAEVLTGRKDRRPTLVQDHPAAGAGDRVLSLADLVGRPGATVEDLMPPDMLAEIVDRLERRPETMLSDTLRPDIPFVSQVEAWASAAGVPLRPDWRLDLARRMRDRLLARGPEALPGETRATWLKVIEACLAPSGATRDVGETV